MCVCVCTVVVSREWPCCDPVCVCVCFPDPVQISGEQRLKAAQDRAHKNQASLQKDLEARRAGGGVRVKQEPVSDREDESMDTSPSVPNGSVNGYPGDASQANGTGGGHGGEASSQELQDFVLKTFRKHFVMTLSEFKRLLNLHLASMPVGRSLLHSLSDHTLRDAIVLSHCRQILVPVSIPGGPPPPFGPPPAPGEPDETLINLRGGFNLFDQSFNVFDLKRICVTSKNLWLVFCSDEVRLKRVGPGSEGRSSLSDVAQSGPPGPS